MKSLFLACIAIFSVLLGVTTAGADDAYEQCMAEADGTNAAWSACGADYLDRLDSKLNETWKTVFPALTDEGKAALRAEQRSWNDFKELSCLYLANGDYGREGQVLEFPLCRAEVIEQRVTYLEALSELVDP